MSHFSVTVTVPSSDLNQDPEFEEVEKAVTERLRPWKEIGCGSDLMPPSEHVKWQVYDREAREDELFDTASDVKEAGYPDPHTDQDTLIEEHGLEIYQNNPQKKWDWFSIGGRWAGYWPVNGEHQIAMRGKNGLMGSHKSTDGADVVRKGDVDFDAMMDEAETEARRKIQMWESVLEDYPNVRSIDFFRQLADNDEINRGAVGPLYHGQPGVEEAKDAVREAHKARGEGEPHIIHLDDLFELRRHGPEEFVRLKRLFAVVPYSIVHQGEWIANGEMGWFGVSTGEGDWATWVEEASDLMFGLPDDTVLVNCDCHI